MEYVCIAVLIAVILYQGYQNHEQKRSFEAQIKNLLDRLMSKDYPMYVQGEIAKDQMKHPQEPYEEQGIPI